MTINQSGSDIIVSYTWQNGRIIGKLVGNVLAGNWIQGSSDQRCSYAKENSFYWGKLNITFSGNSYSGTWGYCDTEPKTDWKGKRK
jgi:hypothetical protein